MGFAPTSTEAAKLLAKRVCAARFAKNMTQSEVAAKAGLPVATYKQFERTGRLTVDRLFSVFNALGSQDQLEGLMKEPPVDFDRLWEKGPAAPARVRVRHKKKEKLS